MALSSESQDILLEPVIAEGSPSDLWFEDSHALFARPYRLRDVGASGPRASLASDLASSLPVPVSTTGRPGAAAGFRGIGRSAEETTVSMLGVPLDPPQGGGFDLSTFPSYLWEQAVWHPGGGSILAGRGMAGGIALVPWTEGALRSGDSRRSRGVLQASDPRQIAVSAGFKEPGIATTLGFTGGDVVGPAGMVSFRPFGDAGGWTVHLLASSLDAKVITPYASTGTRQTLARGIPIVQWEGASNRVRVRVSAFGDVSYLKYEDPGASYARTRDHTRQGGATATVRWENGWSVSGTLRNIRYSMLAQSLPAEFSGQFAVGKTKHLSPCFVLNFEAGGVGLERQNIHPVGSLGIGNEPSQGFTWRSRISAGMRFPSLTDRAYVLPGFFVGNPDLLPERNLTALLGAGWKARNFTASADLLAQRRLGAILTDSSGPVSTVVNRGRADQLSALPSVRFEVDPGLTVQATSIGSSSRVEETRAPFPYLATWQHRIRLTWESANRGWILGFQSRASLRRPLGTPGRELPGYGLWDVDLSWRPNQSLTFSGGLENLADRSIEFTAGLPSIGRIASLNLMMEL